jgi:hypothetical protein
MVTAGDLVCSDTVSVEVECEDECEEAEVDVDYREENCTLGTVKYLATANMKGRFCVSGGGIAQTLLPEAQTTLGNPLFSLTPGNCVDDVDNVWIKVPEGSEFTVSFAGSDACEEWEDTFQAPSCPPVCELPDSGEGELDLPNANPETECGHFGLVPGDGGFYITKCGQFYQWGTSHPPADGQCTNGQDVSHIRECDCS